MSKLALAALVVALFTIALPAQAQSASDLVYVGGRLTGRAPLDDRSGKREDRSFSALLAPPSIALGVRDLLSVGLAYRYTSIDIDSTATFPGEPGRRNLHALDLSLGYSHVFGRRWIGTVGVVPGLRTDFESKLSDRDVQVAGFLVATYLIGGSPSFRLSFGLASSTKWSFSPVIPFATIAYKNDDIALDAGIGGLSAVYRFGDRAELGLFGSFSFDWYHVESGSSPKLQAARYLQVFDVGVGPQLNVRTVGPVWLNARAGYTVVRHGTFGDSDRNEIGGVSLDTGGTFFAQIGVSIRDARR